MDLRIISLGTLAAHPLWGENVHQPRRTGHATTALIRVGARVMIVDPGLPEAALLPRLSERANIKPADVTDVFLTTFKPDCRRGIGAFENADWWVSAAEREGYGVPLAHKLKALAEEDDPSPESAQLRAALENEVAVLKRCRAPEDELAPKVSVFPLPGVTPGCCGLLLEEARSTIVICGDAIPTIEHLEQGQVLPGALDVNLAKQSFAEAVEVADLLVLGRDNLVVNPTKRPF